MVARPSMSAAAWASVAVAGAALGFSIFAGVVSLLSTVAKQDETIKAHSEAIKLHSEELKDRRAADETWKRDLDRRITEAINDIGWMRARMSNSRTDLIIPRDTNTN